MSITSMNNLTSTKKPICYSSVIFDMDGLVLDTESGYFYSWKKAAALMGYNLSDKFCHSLSGLQYQIIEQRLLAYCGNDFDLNHFRHLSNECWYQLVESQGIPVNKGFFNLLNVLNSNHIKFCLATNSRRKNALECLKFAGLDNVFSIIVSRDDVDNGKPDPEIFMIASEMMEVPVSRCLVVEDSLIGLQAADCSGAKSVFIPSIFPVDKNAVELADFYFNDLEELVQIFKEK